MALLCSHSHFFREEVSRHESARACVNGNKKRKISVGDKSIAREVKKEDGESETEGTKDHGCGQKETVIRLPDVDPAIFGLFLKFVYMGFYPGAVDATPGATRSAPYTTTSTQHDPPYTPAKAAMPPPANLNSRQPPPDGLPLPLPPPNPTKPSPPPAATSREPTSPPPSIDAYLLSIRLGAPSFMNHALNHIYYGIGKYFALTPRLVDYTWRHTPPGSPLCKLLLAVLAVHWPSLSTHIIAKHPALNKAWNEVFDTHTELRHEFTMGLQGGAKVAPVQAYFVNTAVPSVAEGKAGGEVVQIREVEVDTSAAEAAAVVAAREQEGGCGGGKEGARG